MGGLCHRGAVAANHRQRALFVGSQITGKGLLVQITDKVSGKDHWQKSLAKTKWALVPNGPLNPDFAIPSLFVLVKSECLLCNYACSLA